MYQAVCNTVTPFDNLFLNILMDYIERVMVKTVASQPLNSPQHFTKYEEYKPASLQNSSGAPTNLRGTTSWLSPGSSGVRLSLARPRAPRYSSNRHSTGPVQTYLVPVSAQFLFYIQTQRISKYLAITGPTSTLVVLLGDYSSVRFMILLVRMFRLKLERCTCPMYFPDSPFPLIRLPRSEDLQDGAVPLIVRNVSRIEAFN
ncbi:hypothetical protein BDN72DRAFT_438672 [Pluteus cervinus]|uniref:Uncharacterized protein n=1 Tax=Pluteus cervinus TaxID=181527 RepID=A0ACD3A8B6_9AGAR|nr:hypothetical protein BDN72DRAFT_438672 [Pluteus cervinus]